MVGIVDKALPGDGKESLNIGSHINALTSFVRDTSTPMTIGIQGDWGSGKTSLCNQIFTQLEKATLDSDDDENYKQIWVNAWEHSLLCSPEESLIKIINQIIEELIEADASKTKAESLKRNVKNVLHAPAYESNHLESQQNDSVLSYGMEIGAIKEGRVAWKKASAQAWVERRAFAPSLLRKSGHQRH